MPTPLASFPGYAPCDKIDAQKVDAYFDLYLDPENPTGIILETSWGEYKIDLASIVKEGETVTHLELLTDTTPQVIRYKNEDGEYECITGDELSRIISLHLLKDVDQTNPPQNGDTYVYNDSTSLFETYPLVSTINNLNAVIGRLQASITNLQNQINAIDTRLTTLEGTVTDITNLLPFWPEDKTTKIARGDINYISDPTNTDNKTHGLFTHDKSVDQYADSYDA